LSRSPHRADRRRKKARYRQSRVFGIKESVPLLLDGEEIEHIKVKHLLPCPVGTNKPSQAGL
jgi:hypothetical protein